MAYDARLVEQLIDHLVADCYQIAVDHGWWEEGVEGRDDAPGLEGQRTFGDLLALMHSELSEALEEYRSGHGPAEVYYVDGKPEGVPVELVDVMIRIFDAAGRYQIPLGQALVEKIEFNRQRPYRHGGKVM